MNLPPVSRSTVIAEWDREEGVWLVMWPDGSVTMADDATVVIRAIRQHGRRRAGRDGIEATKLEWRNCPPGFQPPS